MRRSWLDTVIRLGNAHSDMASEPIRRSWRSFSRRYLVDMVSFEEASAPPEGLRQAYLDGLPEPQELFLEGLVASGRTWCHERVAYAVARGNQLVEFFVSPSHHGEVVTLFDAAMDVSGATAALCKSFDTQMLFAALSRPAKVTAPGLLFRRIANSLFTPSAELTFRNGLASDAEAIAEIDDGFFANLSEIQSYAEKGGLFVLHKEGEIIGCGIATPVVAGRPAIDVGMWVTPHHRRKGYGSYIVAFLKDHYLKRGLRPICGCATQNIASHRALRAAGFEPDHRILHIQPDYLNRPA
jgi:GNAT superfamily N-acetyltransferase